LVTFSFGRQAEIDGLEQNPLPLDALVVPRSSPLNIPDVLVLHPLGAATSHPQYVAAKAGNPNAAVALSRDLVTPEIVEVVRAAIGVREATLVPVLAVEQCGRNMIPLAVAIRLARALGMVTTQEIIQTAKANRSAKSALDRVFAHAYFGGEVEAGKSYILIDDTLTQGGTFAALADHIARNGGTVVGAIALTGKQYSARLRLSGELLEQLRTKHGDAEDAFRSATGYGFAELTESEARALVRYKPAQSVRATIFAQRDARRR